MTQSLSEYAQSLFGGEDPTLRSMREGAAQEGVPAIQVPPELGRLLQLLIRTTGARRVLEVGTLFGYSSVVMARALPEGGKIVTLEVNPKHAQIANRNFRQAGVADRIEVREGPAIETLAVLRGQTFDFVFIDADKPSYPAYLEAVLGLTGPGAVIVADNVWRAGSVAEPHDEDSRGMAQFNRDVAANDRLYTTIIPSRDCKDAATVSLVVG